MPLGLRPRIAVLIPAHDEQLVIGTTLASVTRQLAAGDRLVVVADNCSDRTAEVARQCRAEVTERTDAIPSRQGLCAGPWIDLSGANGRAGSRDLSGCGLPVEGWLHSSPGAGQHPIRAAGSGRVPDGAAGRGKEEGRACLLCLDGERSCAAAGMASTGTALPDRRQRNCLSLERRMRRRPGEWQPGRGSQARPGSGSHRPVSAFLPRCRIDQRCRARRATQCLATGTLGTWHHRGGAGISSPAAGTDDEGAQPFPPRHDLGHMRAATGIAGPVAGDQPGPGSGICASCPALHCRWA